MYSQVGFFIFHHRKLIINNGLEFGSQLPYIKAAKELGFSVLVLNTNELQGHSSPSQHAYAAWLQVVRKVRRISLKT